MSDAAKKAARWIQEASQAPFWREEGVAYRIDQAADEKYRPLVEAAELCVSTGLAAGQSAWLREALRNVKEDKL